MSSRKLIVVAGAVAQRSRHGGHAWCLAQWALGLRRLGWDVLLIDECASLEEVPLGQVDGVIASLGLRDAYALVHRGDTVRGPAYADLAGHMRKAAAVINVNGFVRDPALLDAARLRVFLDVDPGYTQMWRVLGLADTMSGHDRFVTVGRSIGRDTCLVPDAGVEWITTLPPVVLDAWSPALGGGSWTSVATWRCPYGTLEYEGAVYGSRVHEFRKVMGLPGLVSARFELALEIAPEETADRALLDTSGWKLADPRRVAWDPGAYRRFVRGSRAELCVAQQIYVDTRSGWFSDRSACYLASGKPVVARATGFEESLPVGEGLLSFSTLDEAATAVNEVERGYDRHARAARALAEQHFDSDRVIGDLLERLELV